MDIEFNSTGSANFTRARERTMYESESKRQDKRLLQILQAKELRQVKKVYTQVHPV